jgi:hypothetical protein
LSAPQVEAVPHVVPVRQQPDPSEHLKEPEGQPPPPPLLPPPVQHLSAPHVDAVPHVVPVRQHPDPSLHIKVPEGQDARRRRRPSGEPATILSSSAPDAGCCGSAPKTNFRGKEAGAGTDILLLLSATTLLTEEAAEEAALRP